MSLLIQSTQYFLNWYLKINLKPDGVIGTNTNTAIKTAILNLKQEFKNLNYKWDSNNWNLIGFRLSKQYTNELTDWFICVNESQLFVQKASTVPGNYYVYNPLSYGGITGCAVLIPNQYLNTWKFVTASNWTTLWLKEPYFQQIKEVSIYRDTNKDKTIDINMPIQRGLFGINLHHAGLTNIVANWSAGCQVSSDLTWKEFLTICNFKNSDLYSYTLIQK